MLSAYVINYDMELDFYVIAHQIWLSQMTTYNVTYNDQVILVGIRMYVYRIINVSPINYIAS